MKLWERVVEARLRKLTIVEQQFGFMPGRNTMDAIYTLQILQVKCGERVRRGSAALHVHRLGEGLL